MASAGQIRRRDTDEVEEGVGERTQPKRGGHTSQGSPLPLISELDRQTMAEAKRLLAEAAELRERLEDDKIRLDEIKDVLISIAQAHDLKGLRWGRIGLEYHGERTRRVLDKELLLENGVDADTIVASYRETEPFISSRWVEIK